MIENRCINVLPGRLNDPEVCLTVVLLILGLRKHLNITGWVNEQKSELSVS